jgi:hypothetical protein
MPSLLFRRVRALVLLLALIVLVWGGVRLIGWAVFDHGEPPTAEDVAAPPPPTSESATAELATAVDRRTEGIGGRVSVAALDLDTRVTATFAADQTFATASIVKVDILTALLVQKNGQLTESEQVSARRMIQNSDNAAASALWKQIGGAKGLAAANQQLGLTATTPGTRGRWGVTTTTVGDQLRLLSVIFTEDSPLSAESRAYVRSLLGNVADDQDWGISAADSPGGAKAFVKNGWLPHSGGWIVNSIGQVEHGGHRLLIVVLSDGRPSKNDGIDVLEGISTDAASVTVGS